MADLHAELKARVEAYGFDRKQLADVTGYGRHHIDRVFRKEQPGSLMFWQCLLDACEKMLEELNAWPGT